MALPPLDGLLLSNVKACAGAAMISPAAKTGSASNGFLIGLTLGFLGFEIGEVFVTDKIQTSREENRKWISGTCDNYAADDADLRHPCSSTPLIAFPLAPRDSFACGRTRSAAGPSHYRTFGATNGDQVRGDFFV